MRNYLQPGCQRVPVVGMELGGQFGAVQLLGLGQGLSHYLHTPCTGQTLKGLSKGCVKGEGS